jgi:hypothetical protein
MDLCRANIKNKHLTLLRIYTLLMLSVITVPYIHAIDLRHS